MIILAIDSTAITASVALLDNETVIGVSSIHNKLTHSEKLLPMIDELLKNSGYTIDDVALYAVSEGPGSFTGVRIGIATVKGLSFEKNTPVVGVSALEALAENLRISDAVDGNFVICPSMDARRSELYNAIFSFDGSNIERITSDRAISCEELYDELTDLQKNVIINGDGADKFYNFIKSRDFQEKVILAPELLLLQNAVSVGKIAFRKYLQGEFTNGKTLAPLYLRTSQAERINLSKEK